MCRGLLVTKQRRAHAADYDVNRHPEWDEETCLQRVREHVRGYIGMDPYGNRAHPSQICDGRRPPKDKHRRDDNVGSQTV